MRLVALHYETKNYQDALKQGETLLRELKKMEDNKLLIEVQLTESRTYHALGNLQKSKAALTSARYLFKQFITIVSIIKIKVSFLLP